jgi:hypothetical protein
VHVGERSDPHAAREGRSGRRRNPQVYGSDLLDLALPRPYLRPALRRLDLRRAG